MESPPPCQSSANAASEPAWRALASPDGRADAYIHQDYVPVHLIQAAKRPPRRVLDVGCFAGAAGAHIKTLHPGAWVAGVEPRADAAARAAQRLDHVQAVMLDKFDFQAAGIGLASIDTVVLADVLEHMYDPWAALLALRPWLSADAQLLVSLPNVRNLWLMDRLIAGDWPYEPQGLLDVTHIRFFTRKTAVQMFEQTGYRIDAVHCHIDERCRGVLALPAGEGGLTDVNVGRLSLRGMSRNDLAELATLQFYFVAEPDPAFTQGGKP